MNHKNNHARSKQKRKALRLNNRQKHVIEKRLEKLRREHKPKGKTLILPNNTASARDFAIPYETMFPNGGWFPQPNKRYPNQRQKRKRWASNPHLRKAA